MYYAIPLVVLLLLYVVTRPRRCARCNEVMLRHETSDVCGLCAYLASRTPDADRLLAFLDEE